jgi:ParB/RepB/Spo0J family partition protein
MKLNINDVQPNPNQPRKHFDEAALLELAESIRSQGIIQPIAVAKPDELGQYTIIAGERRWRAAKLVGLAEVPVIVHDYNEQQASAAAIIENTHRADLSVMERAEAYKALRDTVSSNSKVAELCGVGETTVSRYLALLKLPEVVQAKLRSGELDAKTGEKLAALRPKDAVKLAAELADGKLSEREVAARVKQAKHGEAVKTLAKVADAKGPAPKPAEGELVAYGEHTLVWFADPCGVAAGVAARDIAVKAGRNFSAMIYNAMHCPNGYPDHATHVVGVFGEDRKRTLCWLPHLPQRGTIFAEAWQPVGVFIKEGPGIPDIIVGHDPVAELILRAPPGALIWAVAGGTHTGVSAVSARLLSRVVLVFPSLAELQRAWAKLP